MLATFGYLIFRLFLVVNEKVYGNTLEDCQGYGLKITESPQGRVCGNNITLPLGQDENDVRVFENTTKHEMGVLFLALAVAFVVFLEFRRRVSRKYEFAIRA